MIWKSEKIDYFQRMKWWKISKNTKIKFSETGNNFRRSLVNLTMQMIRSIYEGLGTAQGKSNTNIFKKFG